MEQEHKVQKQAKARFPTGDSCCLVSCKLGLNISSPSPFLDTELGLGGGEKDHCNNPLLKIFIQDRAHKIVGYNVLLNAPCEWYIRTKQFFLE